MKYSNVINLKEDTDGVYTYKKYNEKELGDYQTPLYFTDYICEYLKNDLKISPDVVIEPTCGIGNFLRSASNFFPESQLYGIEIDANKINKIDKGIPNLELINEDIFKFNLILLIKINLF